MEKEKRYLEKIAELEKKIDHLMHAVKKERYGLVWMDVPEAFEDDIENKLPILKEAKEKAIFNNDGKPTHILIEGENYHALTCLNYTHNNKIDVIYIDPPYNVGTDFRYKDKRIIDKFPDGTDVPKDHPLRHSYWISFMKKRLELCLGLLKDTGIIIISIDDNEIFNLVLLCNKIFSDKNLIAILPTVMNLKGNQDQFGFAGTHEYTLVYAKDKSKVLINQFSINDEELVKWDEDEIGYFKKGATLKATGAESRREDRPKMFYPILFDITSEKLYTINDEEYNKIYDEQNDTFNDKYLSELKNKYEEKGIKFILPIIDENLGRWRWGWNFDTKRKLNSEVIVIKNGKSISLYKKQRPALGDIPSKKPKTIFYKPEYSSGNGTAQLKKILGEKKFDNPKPVDLIKDLILLCGHNDAIILDFFAGSGTTGQAVMELNEIEGDRQFILVTNNEKNIMDDVCYPRLFKVMKETTYIPALGNSMKYYKTDFVGKHKILGVNDEDKIKISQHAGELLALAENTLNEIVDLKNDFYQFFENEKRYTAVYFREELSYLNKFREIVISLKKPVTVYMFSWGENEFIDIFEDKSEVEVKSIPQPILEVYKTIYNLS